MYGLFLRGVSDPITTYDTWQKKPILQVAVPLVGPPAGVLLNFFLPGTGGFFWWESFVGGFFLRENLVNSGRVKWAELVVYGI